MFGEHFLYCSEALVGNIRAGIYLSMGTFYAYITQAACEQNGEQGPFLPLSAVLNLNLVKHWQKWKSGVGGG